MLFGISTDSPRALPNAWALPNREVLSILSLCSCAIIVPMRSLIINSFGLFKDLNGNRTPIAFAAVSFSSAPEPLQHMITRAAVARAYAWGNSSSERSRPLLESYFLYYIIMVSQHTYSSYITSQCRAVHCIALVWPLFPLCRVRHVLRRALRHHTPIAWWAFNHSIFAVQHCHHHDVAARTSIAFSRSMSTSAS